jgi:2-methylcitrate dehydratase PrpD
MGYGIKCPAPSAALVNGTMIHALDYDDGHQLALVHIGCVVVSTCFAIAERIGGVGGKDFITAMVLGADFMARLGMASRPGSSLINSGWHPTTLYGYLAAAAMAGKLMRFDEERLVNAIGIAYHQCAGNGQGAMDGALTKRLGPGLAARGGITAALMAERGISGAKNILEGKRGMFNQYHNGDYDPKILTADLGQRFEGINIGAKPYPCCGFTHAFIDAALSLGKKHAIEAEEVREIRAYAGDSAYNLSVAERCVPRTIVDSQFSVPWAVATAVVKGKVTLEDFTESAIKNEEVLRVSKKVNGIYDRTLSRHGVEPGRLTIVMKDGTEHSEDVEHCLGSIENPMTFEDCARKFRECAVLSVKPLSRHKLEKVIDSVRHMEGLGNATEIIAAIV